MRKEYGKSKNSHTNVYGFLVEGDGYSAPLDFPTVPNGCGKSALLETSQFQNAIAHFELLRRTTSHTHTTTKNNEPHQRYDSLFLAETARFELAGDCSLTDFESAPL